MRLLADLTLIAHALIALFVVAGLPIIVVGNLARLEWVNAWWFRVSHIACIAIIVAQAWLGVVCPLTTLEMWLRDRAGQSTYDEGFIEHWIGELLFYDAPTWVFTTAYSLFGALMVIIWWRYPPNRRGAQ